MYFTRAVAYGLFLLLPSSAVSPAFAANAISVLEMAGSTLASPRLIDRDATVRYIESANGLLRHASTITTRNCLAGSIASRTRSSENASS
jgi:hypothetical protein